MSSMYKDVVKFHQEILNVQPEEQPTLHSQLWITERYRFLMEEIEEFYGDAMDGNIVGATDGLLDTIYVALGTLYMMGVPVETVWSLVQRANMAKVRGTTKRGNAIDAVKPEGWVGPEAGIAAVLLRSLDGDETKS